MNDEAWFSFACDRIATRELGARAARPHLEQNPSAFRDSDSVRDHRGRWTRLRSKE